MKQVRKLSFVEKLICFHSESLPEFVREALRRALDLHGSQTVLVIDNAPHKIPHQIHSFI